MQKLDCRVFSYHFRPNMTNTKNPHTSFGMQLKRIPCPQKGGKFYPILLHKFITHRTGKIYLLFPDGL